MVSRYIGLLVFACIFGSAMVGFFLGKVLRDRHLDSESKDIVKLATGLIATLSALVLGLLVSSAKETFEQFNNEMRQMAVNTVLLDRVLAQYGPEGQEIRAMIKSGFATATGLLISGDEAQLEKLDTPEAVARLEGVQAKLRSLSPQNDGQRELQSRAMVITGEMAGSRWLLIMSRKGSVSKPLLVVLVLWLSVIFAAWGLFSPRNLIVALALFASALSASGAIFLILEMDQPLTGWIRVSPTPIQQALAFLGQ